MSTIGDMAEGILGQVAERTKTANVSASAPQGEIGQALLKVASLLRNEATAQIDYTDLAKFRVTHGV